MFPNAPHIKWEVGEGGRGREWEREREGGRNRRREGATTLSIITFCITALSITTFSIMAFSLTLFSITIRKGDAQHDDE